MIGTSAINTRVSFYQPMDDVETSLSAFYADAPSVPRMRQLTQPYRAIPTQPYHPNSNIIPGNSVGLVYEVVSGLDGDRLHGQIARASLVESHVTSVIEKCSVLARKMLGFRTAWLNDVDSTVSSPRSDAKLHLHNLKQYEISYSRRRALEDAFERKEVDMLNWMLYSAADELRDTSLGVSLLRATYRARSELKMWNVYRDIVQLNLHDHPDAKKLLRGLVG